MGNEPKYELRTPGSAEEWQAYHAIRRKVLFENRGRFGVYDEHHPDEHRRGNYPLLLLLDGVPIGVIRVDVDGDRAIFRRVAVREAVASVILQMADRVSLARLRYVNRRSSARTE